LDEDFQLEFDIITFFSWSFANFDWIILLDELLELNSRIFLCSGWWYLVFNRDLICIFFFMVKNQNIVLLYSWIFSYLGDFVLLAIRSECFLTSYFKYW
jgi:hypothetical protein